MSIICIQQKLLSADESSQMTFFLLFTFVGEEKVDFSSLQDHHIKMQVVAR